MTPPEIFRYNSIISCPMFGIISYLLVRKLPDFSFYDHTLSMSVFFLSHPVKLLIFRLNFIIKSLLDFGFYWYLFYRLNISFRSPFAWLFLFSALFFGLLAIFLEGKNSLIHRIFAYGSGIFWIIGEVFLAGLTGNAIFINLTYVSAAVANILTFGYMFSGKMNVVIQILCWMILYGWLVIYVFGFL